MDKNLIKTARILLSMSQQELAEAVGVNHTLISKIEAGTTNSSPEVIARISEVFSTAGVDFNVLYHLDNLMKNKGRT